MADRPGPIKRAIRMMGGFVSSANPFGLFGVTPPGLEAAAVQGRLSFFQPNSVHLNTLMRRAGPNVLARARHLVRNNCYAAAAVRSWESATVGTGIKPISEIEDKTTRAAVNKAWYRWTDQADANGLAGTDFYGLQRTAAHEAFVAGECFLVMRTPDPEEGLEVPLQFELLPSEQLTMSQQPAFVPPGVDNAGGRIRMGIEFDARFPNRRVAYWFNRSNPTDDTIAMRELIRANEVVRIPAADVLHIFDPIEAGQIRGLTRFSPAIVKLFQLDTWDDAELERQRQQAVLTMTIETPAEMDPVTNLLQRTRPEPWMGEYVTPGTAVKLYGGEKLNLSQPPGVSGTYEAFQYRVILALAAALGIPYAEISADLNRTTYASSRAGLLAFRSAVEAFQHSVMVYKMLRPAWIRWMDTATLVGALPWSLADYAANPERFRRMKGITPRAAWVDPLKDVQALSIMIDKKLIPLREAIAMNGNDFETVMDEIAEDTAVMDDLGIAQPLPGWGSRTGQVGQGTAATTVPTETDTAAA